MDRTVVAVFKKPQQVKEALEEIQGESLANSRISVVVRGEFVHQGSFHEEIANELAVLPSEKNLDLFNAWLVQAPPFQLEDLGEVIVAGPIANELMTSRDGQNLADALIVYGLSPERSHYYEYKVRVGNFLAIVQTEHEKVNSVANLLRKFGGHDVEKWNIAIDHPTYPIH